MKTDLAKILSVRGQRGLFSYIAQSRSGAIAESLRDHKRTNFAANAGITTLADISIYTLEGELKLKEVFLKLQSVLGDADGDYELTVMDATFIQRALVDISVPYDIQV